MKKMVIDAETGAEFDLDYTSEFIKDMRPFWDYRCPHETKELRLATIADGRKQKRYQCLDCGQLLGGPVKMAPGDDKLPAEDSSVRERFDQKRNAELAQIEQRHVGLQKANREKFDFVYSTYLKSDAWKLKKEKVLERAGGLCEGCREQPATTVHHLTYAHIGDELLFELVALCQACHWRCHSEPVPDEEAGALSPPSSEDGWDEEELCLGCRMWGGDYRGRELWCTTLGIPAKEAQADRSKCNAIHEPLK